jgi:hypothetical protein
MLQTRHIRHRSTAIFRQSSRVFRSSKLARWPGLTDASSLFDWRQKRTTFQLDRRLWGGAQFRGAAGRAGSLEGTPPRHFYALPSAKNTAKRNVCVTTRVKIGLFK